MCCPPHTCAAESDGEGVYRLGDVPIHAVDPVVRRAAPLQRTADAAFAGIEVGRALAKRLALEHGDRATVRQNAARFTAPVVVDSRVPEDTVRLPAGIPETAGLGPAIGPVVIEKG